ncbi:MAG: AAA family ATPase [Spirochaetes bacterium]|nr:AAA family ATPase [Spirochaetota bacterium]
MEKITVDNVELTLSSPDELTTHWVGEADLVRQIAAAWITVDAKDIPLNPRLVGKPGTGKTTLAYHAARNVLKRPVYIFQCTMDTRPEDLIVTPVISDNNRITYHASAVVSAMIKGGVAILDEGNRMNEKSWASLAPLLDDRKYVDSIIAGIKIKAHPDFRIAVTMNDDASTYEIPEYIHSRLQPTIEIGFPDAEEEYNILKINIPFADEDILNLTVGFLQKGHRHNEPFSVRDGINIARYAIKVQKSGFEGGINDFFKFSIRSVLGQKALSFYHASEPDLEEKAGGGPYFDGTEN